MIRIIVDKRNHKVMMIIKESEKIHKSAIHNALYEIGRENVKHTRKLIFNPPKTGRLYMIRGMLHQASAPGEPPANLTGKLRRSVDYVVRGSSQMEFGDKELYGKFLELGTTKIAPRHHLSKTVHDRSKETFDILQNNIKKDRKFNAAN